MANQFRNLPKEGGSPRQISEVVNNIMEGKINSTGTFTAVSGTTSTTVIDRRASVNSVILFTGLDSHYYDVDPYISSRLNGSFVVGHKNHGHDSNLAYVIIG
jgi:hypothetical protein